MPWVSTPRSHVMDEETSLKRRLAAILAADIAGYSRLMGEDEAGTVHALKGHQAAILPMIARYEGRIIDIAGDGILAEFPSVVGAAECAIEIQALMAARNQAIPEDHLFLETEPAFGQFLEQTRSFLAT
jgi:class 3 adenylate cyclase